MFSSYKDTKTSKKKYIVGGILVLGACVLSAAMYGTLQAGFVLNDNAAEVFLQTLRSHKALALDTKASIDELVGEGRTLIEESGEAAINLARKPKKKSNLSKEDQKKRIKDQFGNMKKAVGQMKKNA